MPSLWNRMRDIVSASSHASLDAIENPAVMSQQLMREIDDDLQEVSQRKLGQTATSHAQRARTALQLGQEDQARHQLALQLQLDTEIEALTELAASQRQWIDSLKRERATLLREREELGAQARVIQLREGLQADQPRNGPDPYSRAMQRRDRMRGYCDRVEAGLHDLRAAQELRQEELDHAPGAAAASEPDVEAALAALKNDMQQENS